MNLPQKIVLILGGIALLANLAFPPWGRWYHEPRPNEAAVYVDDLGRSLILDPKFDRAFGTKYYYAGLDWERLGLSSAAVVVGTGVLFGLASAFKKSRPAPN